MSSRRNSPSLWIVLLLVAAILVPTTLAASRGDKSQSTRNAYNDRRAPRPVESLAVAAADSASVTLDWGRTWDNVGVEGYGVYLDGTRKTDTASTTYTFTNLVCGKGYTMGVDAFDDAGNRSRATSMFASTAACRDVAPPSAPSDIHTVAATENQVILAWSPSTDDFGVVGYGLYVGGFWVGEWSEPSATITNLACGQTYEIGIDATDAADNQSARTSAFFSTAPCADHTPPSSPTDLAVTRSTGTTVTLTWRASTDASGVVEYGLYKDSAKVGSASSTTADVSGLECGRTYTLGVDAADTAKNRSAPATLTAATAPCSSTTPPPPPATGDTTPPTAPPNLNAYSVSQTTVVLRWDSSTDAGGMAGYQIFRDGTKIGEGPGVHGGLTNQWTDKNRTCGTQYQYAVAGVDTAGNVGPKSTLGVTTSACDATAPTSPPPPATGDTTSPTAPPNLNAYSVSQTTVVLRWDSSTDAGGMAGYQIFRDGTKIGEGPGVHGGLTNQWTDNNRTCGTQYQYAVAGVDTAGNVGPKATLTVKTAACDAPPPSAPADSSAPTLPASVTASTRTATSIALTWLPSSDNVAVTGYGLYRGGTRVGSTSVTTSIFSGLTCGTNYTLGVDAFDAAGNRSQQAVVMVATTACSDSQPPSTPTGLAASNVTGTGLTLTWSAATDNVSVSGYDVYRNGSKIGSTSQRSYAVSGLTCGTAYTLAVAAYDATGNRSLQAQLVTTTSTCSTTTSTSGSVIEFSGTITPSQLDAALATNTSSAVTVRPAGGASSFSISGGVTLTRPNVTILDANLDGPVEFDTGSSGSSLRSSSARGFYIWGADNITVEGNMLDGRGQSSGVKMWDKPAGNTPDGWVIRNNTFQNFYMSDGSHTQALYVGYATNGVIEGNTFTNNGNTAHIFFTWFGSTANSSTSYPRNICVKGNTFGPTHTAYWDINLRDEIPLSARIPIQSDANIDREEFFASC